MDGETHGVIIGRFMPPHSGHQYLVDFGRNMCDHLAVLVCTLRSEPVPGELRYRWMQELFPDVEMIHITEEIPEARKDSPTAIPIWAETVREKLSATPTYVFASEDYGAPLAAELGARFVPVDPARRLFPVSATMIRENPLANWDYIPEPVRPYYLRRISVVEPAARAGGGASGDRPSLARRLAAHYRTLFVADYGRFWEDTVGVIGEADLPLVQEAQQAVESSLARRASRVLFCESDPLQIALRRGLEPGLSADPVSEGSRRKDGPYRGYDLTLLVEPHRGSGPRGEASHAAAEPEALALIDRIESALHLHGGTVERIGAPSEHELLDLAVSEVERVLRSGRT
jgi:NadR type nicotinamide-nucleotide adenylyltransferase